MNIQFEEVKSSLGPKARSLAPASPSCLWSGCGLGIGLALAGAMPPGPLSGLTPSGPLPEAYMSLAKVWEA